VSVGEIKTLIDQMSTEERFFAAAYLRHLAEAADPAYRKTLTEKLDRMAEGKKVSHDQLRRIHEALEREGL
jgi:propanediol dehydratase small subunit